MPAVQPLDSVPVLVFFALFALMTLACYEGGFRVGRWVQDRTADVVEEGPNGVLVGSIVALMAFLLAITTGMASDRFDARRMTVIEEANAIQTAYLRAGYIAEPGSSEARALLEAVRAAPDRELRSGRARGGHRQIRTAPAPAVGDRGECSAPGQLGRHRPVRRVHQRRDRRPRAAGHGGCLCACAGHILWVLVLGSALSLGMVGYSAGITTATKPGHRHRPGRRTRRRPDPDR